MILSNSLCSSWLYFLLLTPTGAALFIVFCAELQRPKHSDKPIINNVFFNFHLVILALVHFCPSFIILYI